MWPHPYIVRTLLKNWDVHVLIEGHYLKLDSLPGKTEQVCQITSSEDSFSSCATSIYFEEYSTINDRLSKSPAVSVKKFKYWIKTGYFNDLRE